MCPIILCGCWNSREIETLAIVTGIAIDKDMLTNKYTITTEVVTSQPVGSSAQINSSLYSSEGDSIFGAVRNSIERTGFQLFWNHSKVVIISESLAMEGIIPVIDWLDRSSDVRSDVWILISRDRTAADTLSHKDPIEPIESFHIDKIMKSSKTLSKYTPSRLWLFVDGISLEGNSQAVTTIQTKLFDKEVDPVIVGSAIFKLDKLVGYIDGNETLYMNMVLNKMNKGLIIVKNVSGTNTDITLEISENKTKLTPLYNNGTASMIIDIYPVASIGEIQGTQDFIKEENLKIFQSEAEKHIEDQIQLLISKFQKSYHSDVLGFGETFYKEKPKIFENLKKNGEDIFGDIKTEVNVHLKINGSGSTTNTIPVEKIKGELINVFICNNFIYHSNVF